MWVVILAIQNLQLKNLGSIQRKNLDDWIGKMLNIQKISKPKDISWKKKLYMIFPRQEKKQQLKKTTTTSRVWGAWCGPHHRLCAISILICRMCSKSTDQRSETIANLIGYLATSIPTGTIVTISLLIGEHKSYWLIFRRETSKY